MRNLLPMLLLAIPAAASAQSVSGPASAIDGDSLTVSGVEVRLFGVDAPEGRQTCERDGQAWRCGEAAAQQLRDLVAGKQVHCRGQGRDTYGRVLAVCSAGYDELNSTMVEQGWATAFRKYSDAYVAPETRAKQAKLGIWSSTFVLPEDYRNANRQWDPTEQPARQSFARPRTAARTSQPQQYSGGCAIKGNHSRRGEWIYHVPGMPYYEQTRPEAMFCTEQQAQAAGYRRAIVRR